MILTMKRNLCQRTTEQEQPHLDLATLLLVQLEAEALASQPKLLALKPSLLVK
jgi:hypothetical protein